MVEKKKMIRGILEIIAEYNRVQYEYGKEYRQYGTDHLLRHDQVHLDCRRYLCRSKSSKRWD